MSRLPQCIAFISSGLKGGGSVLVHCVAGYSRSPAVRSLYVPLIFQGFHAPGNDGEQQVVAAYLMATEGLSVTEALASIEQRRSVQPNAGFMCVTPA